MTDITREEIDAKITASEAKTDTKFEQVKSQFSLVMAELGHIQQGMAGLNEQMRDVRNDVKGLRTTIIQTGITSGFAVLGIMLAVFAVVLAVQGNMLSAFQAGRTVPVHWLDGGHDLPLERPDQIAAALTRLAARLDQPRQAAA